MIDKAIKHGEVTFARYKKDAFSPVQGQLIDQNPSAVARFCFPGHVLRTPLSGQDRFSFYLFAIW
jgi:hypothetical protein